MVERKYFNRNSLYYNIFYSFELILFAYICVFIDDKTIYKYATIKIFQ